MRRQERHREILYSRILVGFSTGFLMKSLSNSSTRPTSTWRDSTPQPPEVTTGTPPRPTWEGQPTRQPQRQRPQQPRRPAQPIIHLQPPGRVTNALPKISGIFHIYLVSVGLNSKVWQLFINVHIRVFGCPGCIQNTGFWTFVGTKIFHPICFKLFFVFHNPRGYQRAVFWL